VRREGVTAQSLNAHNGVSRAPIANRRHHHHRFFRLLLLLLLLPLLLRPQPYNAFLAGFGATVGQFVLTASLRMQSNPANKGQFQTVSNER